MHCSICTIELPKLGNKPNTSSLCFSCYQKDYSKKNHIRKRERAKQLRHEKLKKNCLRCGMGVSVFNRSGFCQDCYSINFNETHREQRTTYTREHLKTPQGRLRRLCRDRVRDAINLYKLNVQLDSKFDLIGCTVSQLACHLESQFKPGMSWENHGKYGWHMDHIRPLASFDLNDPEQLIEACHYVNIQPLWARDNLRKGDKYE